jgi:hypothetical protein
MPRRSRIAPEAWRQKHGAKASPAATIGNLSRHGHAEEINPR